MRIHPLQLTAHKGLRAEILLALKRAQPLTAKQLAHQLGVSVNAIRHHLKELEAEALIAYGREQRGVGERFPEVCAAEERFLRDVLGAAVERRAHIASGCNACEYAITFTTAPPRESP